MQDKIAQMTARCREMVEKVRALYGMDLSQVHVSFDLRGRAAGMAQWSRFNKVASQCKIRFNRDMLTREAFDHVINDTVPHEYAHIVCVLDPSKGSNHDYGWARVCRALGGSGARTHDEEVVYGKGCTYEYITDRGQKVRLSDKRHAHIRAGGSLRYKGVGTVTQHCAYSIVGHQGRTLAQPIVKQGAPVQAAPVQAVVAVVPTPVQAAPVQPLRIVLRPTPAPVQAFAAGQSKAAVSRAIMLSGYRSSRSYEQIITAMISANGYDRQLARATFKANAAKVGIPSSFCQ